MLWVQEAWKSQTVRFGVLGALLAAVGAYLETRNLYLAAAGGCGFLVAIFHRNAVVRGDTLNAAILAQIMEILERQGRTVVVAVPRPEGEETERG